MSEYEKPTLQEDEYFAREEAEQKRRLSLAQASELAQKQKDELKKLHYMKCPKCGLDLHTLSEGAVEVDTCFGCKGVWLDAGELEEVIKTHGHHKGPSVGNAMIGAVINLFKKS